MPSPEADSRSPQRRAEDERIAAEPRLPPPALPPDAAPEPVEAHLARGPGRHRPVAVAGVVENGLVRPLDPSVRLPERSSVIIVASAGR